VLWSFLVDEQMKVYPNEFLVRQTPTADFGAAVNAWNKQVDKGTGPKGQVKLPTQRLASTEEQAPARPQRNAHALDPAARGQWAATLQRAVGNRAARQLIGATRADGAVLQRQEDEAAPAFGDSAPIPLDGEADRPAPQG
jgi:hypothetical protein